MKALPYFDVNAETTLQTYASKKGLRACLIQKGKVVCYASRALTKTEQNYQNLEQEALGTIWGMEKFHYFLYGKEFTLETDQKPLVSIYKKHMVDISPPQREPNDSIFKTLDMQNSHQAWKIHQSFQGNSSNREMRHLYFQTWKTHQYS